MADEVSPVGANVKDDIDRDLASSEGYREAHRRLRPFEEIARVVVMRRARLGLSQQDLADRMGTTASVVSRIESGQHRSSTETLRRLGEALGGHAVIGFTFDDDPPQELVAL